LWDIDTQGGEIEALWFIYILYLLLLIYDIANMPKGLKKTRKQITKKGAEIGALHENSRGMLSFLKGYDLMANRPFRFSASATCCYER
jgi:hypothetical protein